jgi:hypothetical protein
MKGLYVYKQARSTLVQNMEVNHNSCMEITLDTKIEKILEAYLLYPQASLPKRALCVMYAEKPSGEHWASCARKKV